MKRVDCMRFLLVLTIVILGSYMVPDSRAPKPKQAILPPIIKEVNKHIADANYFVYEAVKKEEIEEVIAEETIEEVIAEEKIEEVEAEEIWASLGTYEITAYEWTGNPCANGCYPTEGYTVACNDLPFGTTVYIDGVGYRVVEDRGGGGYGWIDIYLGDVSSCYEWGRQYREVWIVE